MSGGDIVVYTSRLKLGFVFLASLVMVLLASAVLLVAVDQGKQAQGMALSACAVVLFFGACAAIALRRLIVRRPSLVIDRDGVRDDAPAIGIGFLPWVEIERVVPCLYKEQKMLSIVPRELDLYLSRRRGLGGLLARLNIRLIGAPFSIRESILPLSVEELASEIGRRYGVKVGARD
jgi:hypothetical protein